LNPSKAQTLRKTRNKQTFSSVPVTRKYKYPKNHTSLQMLKWQGKKSKLTIGFKLSTGIILRYLVLVNRWKIGLRQSINVLQRQILIPSLRRICHV